MNVMLKSQIMQLFTVNIKDDCIFLSDDLVENFLFEDHARCVLNRTLWEKMISQKELLVIEGTVVLSEAELTRLIILLKLYSTYQQVIQGVLQEKLYQFPIMLQAEQANDFAHAVVGCEQKCIAKQELTMLYLLNQKVIHSELLAGDVFVLDEDIIKQALPNFPESNVKMLLKNMNDNPKIVLDRFMDKAKMEK